MKASLQLVPGPAPIPGQAKVATIEKLRELALECRACPLWKLGTQTVFGEGPSKPEAFFVGEVPGDEEDRTGRPFVGPAGKLFDQILIEVGIDRDKTYVTNVVKHFKWTPRGKRRLHQKPNGAEIAACRPWLLAELQLLKPEIIVCLGATAAQALLGKSFRVSQQRGQFVRSPLASHVMATVHPSSVLRIPDPDERRQARTELFNDLKKVADIIHSRNSPSS